MKNLLSQSLLILIGTIIGWQANTLVSNSGGQASQRNTAHQLPMQSALIQADKQTGDKPTRIGDQASPSSWPPKPATPGQQALAEPPRPASDRAYSALEHFSDLLAQQGFREAFDLLDEQQRLAGFSHPDYQAATLVYLNRALSLGHFDHSEDLIELYLERYYEDIEVRLLMARMQYLQGFSDEAIRTHQFALSYAYNQPQKSRVYEALSETLEEIEGDFSAQTDKEFLIGIYELLDTLSLSRPEYELRLATLYYQSGYSRSATNVLESLAERNTLSGPLKQQAQALLAELASEPESEEDEGDSIALTARANQFIVELQVNQSSVVSLLIDTGASITTIAKSRFQQLPNASAFTLQRSQLFNTANGVTRGEVYRADSVQLGATRFDNIDIAVLDFPSTPNVDGLLGMNILKRFHFQIDQDQKRLHLQPR
jgi:clan AA aspartic protease (TIGR02281 family)